MFFIHIMGRRSGSTTAFDLGELGEKVTDAMANKVNTAIVVSVGKTDKAVMPYVWIRRNDETDEWEGELGDSIKLGIEDSLLIEHDPIQALDLVVDAESITQKRSRLKLTNEEKAIEAKRMVDELFTSLHEES